MKRIHLAAGCFIFLSAACTNDTNTKGTGSGTLAQKNLEAYHIVDKAFKAGDVSHVESAISADFVDHTDREI